MEMVRVTLSSHTLLALAMNQVFSTAHLTSLLMILNVVTSKMPTSFAKVYVCTLFDLFLISILCNFEHAGCYPAPHIYLCRHKYHCLP